MEPADHIPTCQWNGNELTPEFVQACFGVPIRAHVPGAVIQRVEQNRRQVESLLGQDQPLYGINTGFASLCDRRIPADQLETLQENLVLSHAVGIGPPVPDEIVRLMMLFKAHALGRGHSGIRPVTLETLVALLDSDILPVIPCKGSLGASGDLAPLAHMTLALIGRGQVRCQGRQIPAADALSVHGIESVRLGAKEGLAMINGTQFMTAYGADLCVRARRACKLADLLAAMSLEAIRGRLEPFDARIHALRPHPGAVTVAGNMRKLLAHRPSFPTKTYGHRVQDPYSLRCVPAVHGATRDAVAHAEEVVFRDINSVTDNPLVFEGAALSGGNFHGQPVALVLDYLTISVAELASISERRQHLLVNDSRYGLPMALAPDSGLNSGFMIAHYTSAALVSENKVLCHPASVDSIPTAGGQEDHVSMGATAAVKAWNVMENVENVLGIELLLAAQALDFTPHSELAPAIKTAFDVVRTHIPHAGLDRQFGLDIEAAQSLVRDQAVVQAVEGEHGPLD